MVAEPRYERVLWAVGGPGARLPEAGASVRLTGDGRAQAADTTVEQVSTEGYPYWPYRTITISPDLLMALVPADVAPAFTRGIAHRYRSEFGKVQGRLPLAVGNIFFPHYLPMFSVLDAAWRMIDNFRRLHDAPAAPRVRRALRKSGLHTLGTGARDDFHPYVLLDEDPGQSRPNSAFLTVAGWIAHRDDLQEGTPVLERPNLYDGFVLGGSGDRLNMNLEQWPPSRAVSEEEFDAMFRRPAEQPVGLMRMERFEEMMDLWERLRENGAGDRPMRNLWFALQERERSWERAGGAGARSVLASIGSALGQHYCGARWTGEFDEGLRSGLLQKTLQLHWSILKTGLETKQEEAK
jgi:hypothetical protein